MVKTIRSSITLDRLRELITGHIQKLPSYDRVETDSFCVQMRDDSIRLELREVVERDCYCGGDAKCWMCRGTGKRKDHSPTTAWIKKYDGSRAGQLKIEVQTEGTKPDVWKPDVEKIKGFIEGLAGQTCIEVPTFKRDRPVVPVEDALQQSLKLIKGKEGEQ